MGSGDERIKGPSREALIKAAVVQSLEELNYNHAFYHPEDVIDTNKFPYSMLGPGDSYIIKAELHDAIKNDYNPEKLTLYCDRTFQRCRYELDRVKWNPEKRTVREKEGEFIVEGKCGDGILNYLAGESCDDGNTKSGDGCSAKCDSLEICGNAIIDEAAGEVCDNGSNRGGDGCSPDCRSAETCGNGIVDTVAGEGCDDGNMKGGDACSSDCRSDETCGNGIVDEDAGEVCDDGNKRNLDGCSAECSFDSRIDEKYRMEFRRERENMLSKGFFEVVATETKGVYLARTDNKLLYDPFSKAIKSRFTSDVFYLNTTDSLQHTLSGEDIDSASVYCNGDTGYIVDGKLYLKERKGDLIQKKHGNEDYIFINPNGGEILRLVDPDEASAGKPRAIDKWRGIYHYDWTYVRTPRKNGVYQDLFVTKNNRVLVRTEVQFRRIALECENCNASVYKVSFIDDDGNKSRGVNVYINLNSSIQNLYFEGEDALCIRGEYPGSFGLLTLSAGHSVKIPEKLNDFEKHRISVVNFDNPSEKRNLYISELEKAYMNELEEAMKYHYNRLFPFCGNNLVDENEVCDDGNNRSGDGCTANCMAKEFCGDGLVQKGLSEACDDGNTFGGDGCSSDCRSDEICGNGITDQVRGELCDDGNRKGGDGCSSDCRSTEICGNSIVDTIMDEFCDDGNTKNGDGPCAADCKSLDYCNDGIVDIARGEKCDGEVDFEGNHADACLDGCSLPLYRTVVKSSSMKVYSEEDRWQSVDTLYYGRIVFASKIEAGHERRHVQYKDYSFTAHRGYIGSYGVLVDIPKTSGNGKLDKGETCDFNAPQKHRFSCDLSCSFYNSVVAFVLGDNVNVRDSAFNIIDTLHIGSAIIVKPTSDFTARRIFPATEDENGYAHIRFVGQGGKSHSGLVARKYVTFNKTEVDKEIAKREEEARRAPVCYTCGPSPSSSSSSSSSFGGYNSGYNGGFHSLGNWEYSVPNYNGNYRNDGNGNMINGQGDRYYDVNER